MNAATARAQAHDEALDLRRLVVVSSQATSVRLQIAATAAVIAALVWAEVPGPIVAAWVALVLGVREWRAVRLRALVADADTPIAARLRRLVGWNIVIGLANGSAALFMLWLDVTDDALLTMVLVSWAAGAVSTSAPHLRAYLVYSACVFTPMVVIWAAQGSARGIGVAALIAMFAGVQLRFARQNAAVFEESFRIRAENEDLARQLGEARDVAEAANRAKTRFLAAASHDLRQPLHALTLHSGLLAQDPSSPDAPAIAGEISASIDSLARLLDSLLDISKLDAGVVVVERRPIRLQRLLAHVVRSHAPKAADKGLALRVDGPPDAVVETDPLLLERLLRNLVDNAVKYTDEGEVVIAAVAAGPDFEITVRDTGRGIPAEAQARVFEEFFQVDGSGPRHEGGLGLGLAIVKRLSSLLAVPVAMQSLPGAGTTMRLRVPAAAQAAEERAAPPVPDTVLRGLRVLFIDDEEPVRRAMHAVLQRFGCEVAAASGSDEAIARLAGFTPDIVLADFRLHGGDSGIVAVRRLRERLPGLPALLISGDTDAERLREAEASGLRLLHKPATVTRLREAMVEVLDRARAGRVVGVAA